MRLQRRKVVQLVPDGACSVLHLPNYFYVQCESGFIWDKLSHLTICFFPYLLQSAKTARDNRLKVLNGSSVAEGSLPKLEVRITEADPKAFRSVSSKIDLLLEAIGLIRSCPVSATMASGF